MKIYNCTFNIFRKKPVNLSNKLAKFVNQDAKKLWITGDIREISQCKVSDAQVTVKARGHFDLLMEIKHKS